MVKKIKTLINCEAQQLTTRLFILLSCVFIFSCHSGGTVVGSNKKQEAAAPVYDVQAPTIVTPASNPHYSSAFTTNITGLCMTGYRVQIVDLLGFVKQSQICANYSYSVTVAEASDGLYNYFITQKSMDGVVSLPVPFIWIKKSSISVPMISSPAVLPYASSLDNLTISGSCESNATVKLEGDAAGQTTCTNSSFSLNITKVGNGNFTIIVKQTDYAGNSAQTQFAWNKLGLGVSPSAPTLQVGTTQLFTLVGGSGSYTAVLTSNPSGGSFDPATRIYTAGPIANATDVLTVLDSLGVSTTVPITTFHGPADHLDYATVSGDAQDGFTGQMLALPIAAKVVDRYGNGVGFYPTFFRVTQGNSTVSGTVLQTSDINGDIKVNIIAGDTSIHNKVLITPFGSTLPDVDNTGLTQLEFNFITKYAGVGLKGSTFALSSNPSAIVTGDINGDGVSDTVVINSAEPSIGLLLGRANGLFEPMTKIKPVCASPNDIVLADIDEDGLKDIVISCGSSAAAVQIFFNQGSGNFSTATNLPLDSNFENIPYMLKVADIDGDNHLDILTTNAGSGRLSIRKGNGNGTFAAPIEVVVGDSPSGIGIGDFNRDSKKDIIVLNAGTNDLTLVTNLGNMTFDASQSFATGGNPLVVSVQDFNKDGWDDYAVLNSGSSSVTVYLNDKLGGFYEKANLVTGAGPTGMDVKDIDRDGNFDIVASNGTDSTVNVYFGDGTGLFDSSTLPIPVTLNPSAITLADMNGDSIRDILVTGNIQNELEFIPGQAGRKFGYRTAADTNPVDVVFADFNKNGTKDMAVLSKTGRTIKIYHNDGKGLFTVSGSALATGDDSESFIGVDLQKRGLTDFVVANPNRGSVRVFSAQTNGTYASPVDISVGLGPIAIVSDDLNRDSYPDLAVVNGNNSTISVLVNNGSGLFLTKVDYAVGANASDIVATDLNNDGITDLVVSSAGTNTIGVLIGNGDGTFQARVDYGVGNSPTNIVAGDFNNDGFEDIAVLTPVDNAISILLGNGNGSLRAANAYSAGSGIKGLVVGDFNGDGKLDLAVVNSDTFQFTVLHGAGNGQFNTSMVMDNPAPSSTIKASDLNGDNALDFILIDSTNSNINLWLGH